MTADLYIRVSTDEQADKGYSQRDQDERLRKYCELQRITIRKVIFEDHSAKTFNRPQWTELLANLKKQKRQVDIILFTKWDRFSRNAGDAYQMINTLRKFGVEPQAVEQPLDLSVPENKMMLAFYLAAPEVENDRRALNVLHGMRRARKEGRWMCSAPIGYTNKIRENGKKYIAPKEPEASTMKWVFETLATEQYHVEQVYKEAQRKGLKTVRAHFWRLLRNPVYCGKIYVGGYKDESSQHVPGQHEAIITETMFYDVQGFLDGRKKIFRTKIEAEEILQLRGYLICPNCGKLLTGSASKGRSAYYYYYHCLASCGVRFKAENANTLFMRELSKFVPKSGMLEAYKRVIDAGYRLRTKSQREDIKLITEKINEANDDIARGRQKLVRDEMDHLDFKIIKKEKEELINELENKLIKASQSTVTIKTDLDQAIDALSRIDKLYKDGDVRKKREIVGSIYPEKLIFDGTEYRTARLNEVVQLIYTLDKGFNKKRNGQTDQNFDLSTLVPQTGIEPVPALLQTGF
jgi:site-specific DNA recombinase